MNRLNNKGFTLVEVMVSATLIMSVLMASFTLLIQASSFSKSLDIIYTATYLAERRIDLLKRFDFEFLSTAEENAVQIGADGNIDPYGEYLRTTEITTPYNGNAYLAKIKVSVYRIKIRFDGKITDPETGNIEFLGDPVVMETLFADVT